MPCPWCIQACFSPRSILSKLRSQSVRHAYSVANHPRGEQTHLCLRVYVFARLCKCAGGFFICKSNVFPIAFFRQLLAGRQCGAEWQQTCSESAHDKPPGIHTHKKCRNLCPSSLVSFSLLKVSNVIFKNAPKEKTSSKFPLGNPRNATMAICILHPTVLHVHTPW